MLDFECKYTQVRPFRDALGTDPARSISEARTRIVRALSKEEAIEKMERFIAEPQPEGHSRSWDRDTIRIVAETISPLRLNPAFIFEDERN